MRILVTGGAGYIGSITTEKLVSLGHEVTVVDNLSQGHRNAVHPDARFIPLDLSDRPAIDSAFATSRPEAVMHFASKTIVGESMEHPFLYLGDNVTNGTNLLRSAVAHGVKRFILSSTANLFDDPERIPISENERIVPGSPYGESKYILERALHWLDVTGHLKFACLRYFNAAGATAERGEDHSPELHLIPLVIQAATGKRDAITIFGDDYPTPDGTCVRDYIHVSDLAAAHILALGAIGDQSLTYNLGNGNGFSVREVITEVESVCGNPVPVKIGPRRPGDPATLVADSSKIRAELGWKPEFPALRSIVESAWAWHQKNPRGYNP